MLIVLTGLGLQIRINAVWFCVWGREALEPNRLDRLEARDGARLNTRGAFFLMDGLLLTGQ